MTNTNAKIPLSHQSQEPTPEWKALVDAVIAAEHNYNTVMARLNARISVTPPGPGKERLLEFRRQMKAEKKKLNGMLTGS